ncbi:MAG: undecaprenyl-diphosphate phosphatase [candidate division Zixibacteria bacterium]|nr:undecaprenyl-diphosphate phosphatase [candidate division Zixibacteria bacterium]
MSYLDAVILGILQGLTEFLPVSSSGHLVLAQEILGVTDPGVSFEVVVHLGTLLSVLVYFRGRIYRLVQSLFVAEMKEERKIIGFLILGTIPAGLVGFLLEDFFERAFSNPALTSVMLLVTGVILLLTRFIKQDEKPLKLSSALFMGIGQALAIFPGISRSGTTIAFGLYSGVKPSTAAEFSFLLAVPAIGGAAVLKFKDLLALDGALYGQYFVGAIMAFIMGLLAVYGVLTTIKKGKFEYFSYYCFAIGLVGLYLFL